MLQELSDKLRKRVKALQNLRLQSDELHDALKGLSETESEAIRSHLPNVVCLNDKLKSLSTGKSIAPGTDNVVTVQELPALEGEILEASIGDRDFLPAWFLELGAKRQAAVGRIRGLKQTILLPNGNVVKPGDGWGTGLPVNRVPILTNHHVIESADFAKKESHYTVQFSG
ncbi:MAG: hypothetical protein R3C17_02855 [Planctomycetaceae bacterium]